MTLNITNDQLQVFDPTPELSLSLGDKVRI